MKFFKRLPLLLASFIAIPLLAGFVVNKFNNDEEIVYADDVEPKYPYHEVEDEYHTRVYDTTALTPVLVKSFDAPSGYAFHLSFSEFQIDEMLGEMDGCGSDYSFVHLTFSYTTLGSEVYLDANTFFLTQDTVEERRAIFKENLFDYVSDRLLFRIEEATVSNLITFSFRMTFNYKSGDEGGSKDFLFYGESISVEPFNATDFIEFNTLIIQDIDKDRFTIRANPIEGFFYEGSEPNEYGFKTIRPDDWVELDHIELYNYTTKYTIGDTFNFDGTAMAYYSNSTKVKDVTKYVHVYGNNISSGTTLTEKGIFNITAWYFDEISHVSDSVYYQIEVREADKPDEPLDPVDPIIDVEEPRAYYHLTLLTDDGTQLGSFSYGGIDMTFPVIDLHCKIRMDFIDNKGKEWVFYSEPIVIGNPNIRTVIDHDFDRDLVVKKEDHVFSINVDVFDKEHLEFFQGKIDAFPMRLKDPFLGHNLFNKQFPAVGIDGHYYYLPSDHEIELHYQGRDAEFMDKTAEGTYFTYNTETEAYEEYQPISILDSFYSIYQEEEEKTFEELSSTVTSLPYIGLWHFNTFIDARNNKSSSIHYQTNDQVIEAIAPYPTDEKIIINTPDNINLLHNAGDIELDVTVSNYSQDIDYFYNYDLSRDGVVDLEFIKDDKVIIKPTGNGLVSLTITCESTYFSRISKTITIRVLDAIYDVGKIDVPDEFHLAYKDIDVALNIRGFTHIQNLNIEWKVIDKKEVEYPKENIIINNDATMRLVNPVSGDYTITAIYEGIEVDKLTIQVRYADMDKFLRANIWWVLLITIAFMAFVIFLSIVIKRGKTTVEHIEKVYAVYCKCIANDELSKDEVKRIRREIGRCLRRCSDLNIDALNQYEKATRYLRKSLDDINVIYKKYDSLKKEEKEVLYQQLDKDLSKALNVAKEIEAAKQLIDNYHAKANKQNYEVLVDEAKDKKKSKKE